MNKSKLTQVSSTPVIPSLSKFDKLLTKKQTLSQTINSVPDSKQACQGKDVAKILADVPLSLSCSPASSVDIDRVVPEREDKLTTKPKLKRDFSVEEQPCQAHTDSSGEKSSPVENQSNLNGSMSSKPQDQGILGRDEPRAATPVRKTKSLKALSLLYADEDDDFYSPPTHAPFSTPTSAPSSAPQSETHSPPVKKKPTLRDSLKLLASQYSIDESSSPQDNTPNDSCEAASKMALTDPSPKECDSRRECEPKPNSSDGIEVMTVANVESCGSENTEVCMPAVSKPLLEEVEEHSDDDLAKDEGAQSSPNDENSTSDSEISDIQEAVPDDNDIMAKGKRMLRSEHLDTLDIDHDLDAVPVITVTTPGGSWRERITSSEDLLSSEYESSDDNEEDSVHLAVLSEDEGRVVVKVESKDPGISKEKLLEEAQVKETPPPQVFLYEIQDCEEPDIVKPPQDCKTVVNGIACFEANITGKPTPIVRWFKDEVGIKNLRMNSVASKGCSYSLIITDVTKEDEGIYTCMAKSILGLDSASAKLIVEGWLINTNFSYQFSH